MNERTKTGLEILQAAVLIGLLGNVLLRQTPWGLNAFLFVTVFSVAMIALAYRHRRELLTTRTLALHGAMVFFASMFLIRDSIELRIYDTFAILILMGVLVLPNFGVNQRIAGIFHYVIGFLWSGLSSAFAPFVLLGSDIDWRTMPGNRLSKNIFSVLRGLAVALPLMLVFGALFMAADAAYEGMINRAINFDLETVITHVFLTSTFAWLTAGYFRGSLIENFWVAVPNDPAGSRVPNSDDMKPKAEDGSSDTSFVDKFTTDPADTSNSLPDNATILEHINRGDPPDGTQTLLSASKKRDWQNFDNRSFPSVFTLGTVETIIILGLVDLLFLSFVVMQLPYLFGGMELVQNTPDFKLAEYARRGFGELVAVAALVLPMLLIGHWLLRKDGRMNETIFRILAGVQIILLFVIMASAAQRLFLLTGDLGYGMTTIRLYPMVFMIWLAIVFAWFGMTVLLGARQHFAWGALWSAFFVLAATHVFNPDDFIVRTNVQLMREGRDFDAHYNANLSDDAIPAIIEALPSMTLEDQCEVKSTIHYRYRQLGQITDLRSLNYSRRMAWTSLRENDSIMHQTDGCPDSLKNDKESTDLSD